VNRKPFYILVAMNSSMKFILMIAVSLAAIAEAMGGEADRYLISKSILWSPGDEGSKYYRIPAVTKASDGTMIAVADRRLESLRDLPAKIDVVCKRSLDGGRTWGETVVIAGNDDGGGCGDPLLITDSRSGDLVCIFTHGNGFWQSTVDNHAEVMISRSSDNGITWSRPVNISEQFFTTDSVYDRPDKVKGIALFASSGRGLQLDDGKLMFVAVVRPHGPKGKVWSRGVYSDDGGVNWKILRTNGDNDGDESKVCQIGDKNILMSIRNKHGGNRKFARSSDGGSTWSEPEVSATLPDPACNGDIIQIQQGKREKILLHSIPDSGEDRKDVSLYASRDEGKTWKKLMTVAHGWAAYSSLAINGDGDLCVLVEEKAESKGLRISNYVIDIERLLNDIYHGNH